MVCFGVHDKRRPNKKDRKRSKRNQSRYVSSTKKHTDYKDMQITSQVLLDFCRRDEVKREKCTMVAKQGSRLGELLFAEEGEETDTDAELKE